MFADPNAASGLDFFKLTASKVVSSYERIDQPLLTNLYPRISLVKGLYLTNLEPGVRYSVLFQPAYSNGTLMGGSSANQFFGYGIVMCSCTSGREQTGSPIDLSVEQKFGFVALNFTDNSVCEEAYALTRRKIWVINGIEYVYDAVSFAPNYYFYSTSECGNAMNPSRSFMDDLSLSRLEVADT